MLKNIIRLEHSVGNKVYHFLCDNDSPLDHVKEALFQFTKYAGQIEDQMKTQQEQIKKAQEEKQKQQEEQQLEHPKVEAVNG
jgi:hypothetical protein